MKISITLLFLLQFTLLNAQEKKFDQLLKQGKIIFKDDSLKTPDYAKAAIIFEQAIKLNPDNAEAHYFLGYCYSRMNSYDGSSMNKMNLDLLLKASKEFEEVNVLTPKYNGEYILLDPYSKISSEWGSMAMAYWAKNNNDSAIWAFKEGRTRGGFDNFSLLVNKIALDFCNDHSIFMSYGDNTTYSMYYLQLVEGYRKDISIVDISLLNTVWYPKALVKKGIIQFNIPEHLLDSIQYCYWEDSVITINNFTWSVKPSYMREYLLRGDRLFLSLLTANNFSKDIYFTSFISPETQLSLGDYLQHFYSCR